MEGGLRGLAASAIIPTAGASIPIAATLVAVAVPSGLKVAAIIVAAGSTTEPWPIQARRSPASRSPPPGPQGGGSTEPWPIQARRGPASRSPPPGRQGGGSADRAPSGDWRIEEPIRGGPSGGRGGGGWLIAQQIARGESLDLSRGGQAMARGEGVSKGRRALASAQNEPQDESVTIGSH